MPTAGTEGWFNPYDTWFIDDTCDHDTWRWTPEAECKDIAEPEVFFETDIRSNRTVLKKICDTCPVLTECLNYALTHDEHGWWGGTSRAERRRLQAEEGREQEAGR